jgi:hypothetical protein
MPAKMARSDLYRRSEASTVMAALRRPQAVLLERRESAKIHPNDSHLGISDKTLLSLGAGP